MKIPSYAKISEEVGSSFAGKVGRAVKNVAATIGEDAERVLLTKDAERSLGYKLSKTGWGIMVGIGAAASLGNAYDTYNLDRAGVPGGVVTNTPEIPYTDNGGTMAQKYGAGGDIVFAMNRNRRG